MSVNFNAELENKSASDFTSESIIQSCTANLRQVELHDDILIQIFMLLSEYTPDGSSTMRRVDTGWDWVCVTEVCRKWRAVATGTPGLWSVIHGEVFKSASRTKMLLALSKKTDLTVMYSEHHEEYKENALCNLKTILEEMRRIQHLYIHTCRPRHVEEMEGVFRLLEQPATRAESLRLNLKNLTNYARFRLPSISFGQLKCVSLCEMDLSLGISHLRGLLSFSLRESTNISMLELLEVLEASPELNRLTISECAFNQYPQRKFARLDHLLDMVLKVNTFSECYDLLFSIEAPNILRWEVQCRDYLSQDDAEMIPIFSKLLKRSYYFKRMEFSPQYSYRSSCVSVAILEESPKELEDSPEELEDSPEELENSLEEPEDTADIGSVSLYLSFDHATDLDTVIPCLVETFRSKLEEAELLQIKGPSRREQSLLVESWQALFNAAVNVKRVNYDGHGTTYLTALADSLSPGFFPCPKLECLSIYRHGEMSDSEQFMATLEALLRARLAHGLPIRELDTIACTLSKERRKLLSTLVQKLYWGTNRGGGIRSGYFGMR